MRNKWLGCVVGCLLNVGLVSAQDAPSSVFTSRAGEEVGGRRPSRQRGPQTRERRGRFVLGTR